MTTFNIIRLHYYSLIRSHGFLLAILMILFLALNIIPHESAEYITFRLGNYTGYANDAWVGSLGAILSNFIILILGFLFLEGSYQKKIATGIGDILYVSSTSNFKLIAYKWLAYLSMLLTFLSILIVTLYLANINYLHQGGFSLINFIQPFVFFSLPFVVILSLFTVVIDISFKTRFLRIVAFLFVLILFSNISNSSLIPFTDITGTKEFLHEVQNEISTSLALNEEVGFSLGYIAKDESLTFFSWENTNWSGNFYAKIILIGILFLMLSLYSLFFKRYKNNQLFSNTKNTKEATITTDEHRISNTGFQWKNTVLFSSAKNLKMLLQGEFILLKKSLPLYAILMMFVLWIATFFVEVTMKAQFMIPMLMLLLLPLYSNYFGSSSKYNFSNLLNTSVFTNNEQLLVKVGLTLLINVLLLCPILIYQDINSSILTLFIFALIILSSFISNKYLKNMKLFEVSYIIIFISYLSGNPVVSLY